VERVAGNQDLQQEEEEEQDPRMVGSIGGIRENGRLPFAKGEKRKEANSFLGGPGRN